MPNITRRFFKPLEYLHRTMHSFPSHQELFPQLHSQWKWTKWFLHHHLCLLYLRTFLVKKRSDRKHYPSGNAQSSYQCFYLHYDGGTVGFSSKPLAHQETTQEWAQTLHERTNPQILHRWARNDIPTNRHRRNMQVMHITNKGETLSSKHHNGFHQLGMEQRTGPRVQVGMTYAMKSAVANNIAMNNRLFKPVMNVFRLQSFYLLSNIF